MVDAEVVHRVVEPDVGVAPYLCVDPVHVGLVDHVHHGSACPHDADILVHRGAQVREVRTARPALVVLCGAQDEGSHVGVLVHELAVQRVHILGLLGTLRLLGTEDVVEEDGKGTYTEGIHPLQLLDRALQVGLVPLDIATRVHGPYEVHLVLCRRLGQFADALCLVGRVGLTPLVAVVGVVLGTIYIYVHLVASVEVELAQAVLVAPGVSVETLHHAALQHVGPVLHLGGHHLGLRSHLQEGLHTVVGSSLVVTGNYHLLLTYIYIVALHLVGNLLVVCLHGLVAALADDNLDALAALGKVVAQQGYGIGVGLVGSFDDDALGLVKCLVAPHQSLWNWRYVYCLCCH